jgi:hypothetical protein
MTAPSADKSYLEDNCAIAVAILSRYVNPRSEDLQSISVFGISPDTALLLPGAKTA